MNLDLVYAKTREGEEAVHQRTRLVQRNLRTVLIVIDGKTPVGELVEKVGSKEVLFFALEQLERDGFIRPLSVAASPSLTDAGSMENYLEPATDESFPTVKVTPVSNSPFDAPATASANPFAPPPVTASVRPATAPPMDGVSISPFSVAAPAGNPFQAPPAAATPNPFQAPPAAPAANPFQAPSSGSPFGASSAGGSSPFGSPPKAKSAETKGPAEPEEDVVQEPELVTSVSHRSAFLNAKRVAIGGGFVLVLLLGTALFYPYGKYRTQIEAGLSEMTGQTVKITDVEMRFSPMPSLVVSQLSIGAGGDAGTITVEEVRAAPSLGYMLGGKRSFSKLTLRGAKVPMGQLGVVAASLSGAGRSRAFEVSRIDINGMTMSLRDIAFQNYYGHAELSSAGELKQMELRSQDGTMTVRVGPGATEKDPTQVVIEGQGWKSAEGSKFVFDSIAVGGQLSGSRFTADKIEGRIFGGVVQGQLQIDWSAGMMLSGDVNVDYMSAPQLLTALDSGSITVDGQTSARVRFRATGDSWSGISGKVPFEGSFLSKNGAVNGIDLVEAVRRGSKLATRGGATRYEQVIGKYRWDGTNLQLSEIDLTSGAMRATGSMGVLKGSQVSGSFSVLLQSSAASMRTPVALVGTLKDPQLFGGRN